MHVNKGLGTHTSCIEKHAGGGLEMLQRVGEPCVRNACQVEAWLAHKSHRDTCDGLPRDTTII